MRFNIKDNRKVPKNYLQEWEAYLLDMIGFPIKEVKVIPIQEDFKTVNFEISLENKQVMQINNYMTWGDIRRVWQIA